MRVHVLVGWMAFSMTAIVAKAQDRRIVVKPKIPAVCVRLAAALRVYDGRLDADDETRLDTTRVQQALDGCGQRGAVELSTKGTAGAFLVGPISIPAGSTLLVDHGVTLMASRDPRLYDLRPGSCGLVSDEAEGCRPVISVAHAAHATVMGEGVIDGRGGEKLLHDTVTWWDLAEKARRGGRQQVPRLIVADGSDDFTLYRITLRNSPNFHVVYRGGHGLTVWGIRIDTPRTARNTDGIDPMGAEDITVTHSWIRTGDDHIAIKGSEGGVGFVTVADNHFYSGHGMSIGSETYGGVHDVLVKELSLDGADNGIRIKSNPSRGGVVERIVYRDICICDTKMPIVFDTHYSYAGLRTDLYPDFREVRLENVRVNGGGKISVEGLDAQHRVSVAFDGVTLDEPGKYRFEAKHAVIRYGPGQVDFTLTGDDVTGSGTPGKRATESCNGRFVPFEARK